MRLAHLTVIAATPALLVALTACGGSSDSSKDTTTAKPTASTTVAAPTTAAKLLGTSTVPLPAPSPTHPPAPAPDKLSDVDCGSITGSNGATADVIAFANDAGRPGCTEAITVASDYVGAQRTGDAAPVDGWTCEPQPDDTIPHVCFKDGFTIGLRGAAAPASPPPPRPAPIQTVDPNNQPQRVDPTHPPAPKPADTVEDVNCGTVTDAGGGTRTVIAVGSNAGRVGCTEAINVATEYVQTVSDTDVAVISGWNCNAQPDPNVPSMCAKDGLVIALAN
ncbi:hypothetical protein HLB23_35150 [Nocardia uniformis]|uniref:Uncharacterized protein n=1 Tax=Nocardia uniformis TaxID=53432 RepID=A0A849CEF6_9NOCA|nr:hypothetical protein [Nocardia uniformis]NNH75030.1 hypothetical protein [Nocardia uniformis]